MLWILKYDKYPDDSHKTRKSIRDIMVINKISKCKLYVICLKLYLKQQQPLLALLRKPITFVIHYVDISAE